MIINRGRHANRVHVPQNRGQVGPPAGRRDRNAARTVLTALLVLGCGCRCDRPAPAEHGSPTPPASTANPTPTTTTTPAPTPSAQPMATPTPGLFITQTGLVTPEPPWFAIETVDDKSLRAWIEGSITRDDMLVIETSNVRRMTLDLTALQLRWDKRVALRINGVTSELTRKRWPVLRLERSATGAWNPMD